ncbi:hypothetical protein B0H63DRAFT_529557 [Podospora didyma]|uniref:Uncharacterized protein n=1 Tax=Podospora didyma TaxID=330526 RepID=A0AAE0K0S2_9PEZI|nr:hypothetical protein B0H63DRAFT_529557 [Podospora didyma]
MAANFIDSQAPRFHPAFREPSSLNRTTMRYEPQEIQEWNERLNELRETIQNVARPLNLSPNVDDYTWEHVHIELVKAKEAATESDRRGKNLIRKAYRKLASVSSILAPGLSAFPDELSVLHGGLSIIFALARQDEMYRLKIMNAFERVPNIVEMAQNKAAMVSPETDHPKTMQLHRHIDQLRKTLVTTLPLLIDILVPRTFVNKFKSPFRGWKIDRLLDEVSAKTEAVQVCAASIVDNWIADTYNAALSMRAQLEDIHREQKMMRMSITAAQGKTDLLNLIVDHLNINRTRLLMGGSGLGVDMSDAGTALLGYTAKDLLDILNVSHRRILHDEDKVLRGGSLLAETGTHHAITDELMKRPAMQEFQSEDGPSILVVDGHFDCAKLGKINLLSHFCAMFSQALRQKAFEEFYDSPLASPTIISPRLGSISLDTKAPPVTMIVIEYFCALHVTPDTHSKSDGLYGPQGLVRSLAVQLLHAAALNDWVGRGPDDAVPLPHLRDCGDDEGDALRDLRIDALCRLLVALVRLVPSDVRVFCLVDGWSAFEREVWRADYELVLGTFREIIAVGQGEGPRFKLLLTSPASCRWLGNFALQRQKVSLRNMDTRRVKNGRIGPRNALRPGTGRAKTMAATNTGSGLGSGFGEESDIEEDEGYPWAGEGYDRRSSA